MGWKDKMTFRGKRFVEHEIEGETFRFYGNRLPLLEEASQLSMPVAKALLDLMTELRSRAEVTTSTRQADGEFTREDFSTEPASPEVMAARREARHQALEGIFETLADARSRLLLGRLLMDSLRDEFEYKRGGYSVAEVEEFLYGDGESYEGIEAPVLYQMMVGWMKANAKTFGAAGETLVDEMKGTMHDLRAEFLSATDQAEAPTDPTPGSSSPTPMSQRRLRLRHRLPRPSGPPPVQLLMDSVNRNRGAQRTGLVWDHFVGAQGEHKSVKKYDRELRKAYGLEVQDESQDFLREFGGKG